MVLLVVATGKDTIPAGTTHTEQLTACDSLGTTALGTFGKDS